MLILHDPPPMHHLFSWDHPTIPAQFDRFPVPNIHQHERIGEALIYPKLNRTEEGGGWKHTALISWHHGLNDAWNWWHQWYPWLNDICDQNAPSPNDTSAQWRPWLDDTPDSNDWITPPDQMTPLTNWHPDLGRHPLVQWHPISQTSWLKGKPVSLTPWASRHHELRVSLTQSWHTWPGDNPSLVTHLDNTFAWYIYVAILGFHILPSSMISFISLVWCNQPLCSGLVSQFCDVVLVMAHLAQETPGGRDFGMGRGRKWGDQFTSNLGPGWTGSYHSKEGFQVSKRK